MNEKKEADTYFILKESESPQKATKKKNSLTRTFTVKGITSTSMKRDKEKQSLLSLTLISVTHTDRD